MVLRLDVLPVVAAISLAVVASGCGGPISADEVVATTVGDVATTTAPSSTASSTTLTSTSVTSEAGALFNPDQLSAANVLLWSGPSSGKESAAVGFLVNNNGCLGLARQPGEGAMPLRLGIYEGEHVAIVDEGRAIDFNGTIIELGTYITVGGAVTPTHQIEGRDIHPADVARIDAAPEACSLAVGDENWYFDGTVTDPPKPTEYVLENQ